MASTHIEITGDATRLARELRSSVDQIRAMRDRVRWLRQVMDAAAEGNDIAGFRAAFGITDPDAAKANARAIAIYGLWTDLDDAFQNAPIVASVISRLG